MKKLLVVGSCALLGLTAAYAGIEPRGRGPAWATLAPVPSIGRGVEGMSVAGVGDKGIAVQGFDSGDTATTRIYDIAHNVWTSEPMLLSPAPRGPPYPMEVSCTLSVGVDSARGLI